LEVSQYLIPTGWWDKWSRGHHRRASEWDQTTPRESSRYEASVLHYEVCWTWSSKWL